MNKIYDNGYRMLGQNKKLQEYFNKMLESGLDDLEKEYCITILEDLKQNYEEDDMIVIDYDCGMDYIIFEWKDTDIVKEMI